MLTFRPLKDTLEENNTDVQNAIFINNAFQLKKKLSPDGIMKRVNYKQNKPQKCWFRNCLK